MANYTLKTGAILTDEQNKLLSPAATKHVLDNEKEETYRTTFRRERDRILYSGGFRRLQDKTQVLAAYQGGDHRTRLTHTLEVEQIAISIADALGLNRDLVSAIAIGHDVGHTPFGHAAEAALNKLLEDKGGFSHAVQSVRYLCEAKVNSPKYKEEILKGILKHDTDVYAGAYDQGQFDCSNLKPEEAPSLEAQVVYWSDKIAYITHDFEDFYQNEIYYNMRKRFDTKEESAIDVDGKLINILKNIIPTLENLSSFETRDLIRELLANLMKKSIENINEELSKIEDHDICFSDELRNITKDRVNDNKNKQIDVFMNELDKDIQNSFLYKELYDVGNLEKLLYQIKEVFKEFSTMDFFDSKSIRILLSKYNEIENKENLIIAITKQMNSITKNAFVNSLIINFDEDFRKHYLDLRKFLDTHYIMSPEVQRSDAYAKKVITSLFALFSENEKLLPLNVQSKIKDGSSKGRVIADYIASMSDRYAVEVYNNLNFAGNRYKL